jgi:hypothetical protein
MDPGPRAASVTFLITDRAGQFTASFDAVSAADGIKILPRPVPCHNSHTVSDLASSLRQVALRYSLIKPWTACLRLIRAVTSTG